MVFPVCNATKTLAPPVDIHFFLAPFDLFPVSPSMRLSFLLYIARFFSHSFPYPASLPCPATRRAVNGEQKALGVHAPTSYLSSLYRGSSLTSSRNLRPPSMSFAFPNSPSSRAFSVNSFARREEKLSNAKEFLCGQKQTAILEIKIRQIVCCRGECSRKRVRELYSIHILFTRSFFYSDKFLGIVVFRIITEAKRDFVYLLSRTKSNR